MTRDKYPIFKATLSIKIPHLSRIYPCKPFNDRYKTPVTFQLRPSWSRELTRRGTDPSDLNQTNILVKRRGNMKKRKRNEHIYLENKFVFQYTVYLSYYTGNLQTCMFAC